MRARFVDLRLGLALAVIFALTVGVPLANLALDPGQAGHVPTYVVALLGKYLCYAILAVALDLVWGYAGSCRWAMARSLPWAVMRWACI